MIYRPSLFRVSRAAVVTFAISLGLMVTGDLPLVGKVIAGCFMALIPGFIFISVRTRIRIHDDEVEVRTIRGIQVFRRGSASAKEFPVPGGLFRSNRAVEFKDRNGKSVSVPLGAFLPDVQAELLKELPRVLSTSAASE